MTGATAMTTDTIGMREEWLGRGAADWVCLAAAPTFGAMALLTGVLGGPRDAICSATHASPLTGMVSMYLLMSAFHSTPWLKRIAGWRNISTKER
jgi:hypothetical protein